MREADKDIPDSLSINLVEDIKKNDDINWNKVLHPNFLHPISVFYEYHISMFALC